MHIVNQKRFIQNLKAKGFNSIGSFAEHLGIHRNTIHYYISGRHGVFPDTMEKILSSLNVPFSELIIRKPEDNNQIEIIATLIDALKNSFPEAAFVLFGSRAGNKASKYSDWDIGAYCSGDLPHIKYRRMVMQKNNLIEDLPYFVDLVNLNQADNQFIQSISRNWQFLTGSLSAWLELQKRNNNG